MNKFLDNHLEKLSKVQLNQTSFEHFLEKILNILKKSFYELQKQSLILHSRIILQEIFGEKLWKSSSDDSRKSGRESFEYPLEQYVFEINLDVDIIGQAKLHKIPYVTNIIKIEIFIKCGAFR